MRNATRAEAARQSLESAGSRQSALLSASRGTSLCSDLARDSRSRRSLAIGDGHGGAIRRHLGIETAASQKRDVCIAKRCRLRRRLPVRFHGDAAIPRDGHAIVDPSVRMITNEVAPMKLAEALDREDVFRTRRRKGRRAFLGAVESCEVFVRMK